jgi:beta-mannanase
VTWPALPISSPSCAIATFLCFGVPLHEFTGQWSWWGKHGPSAFIDLYLHMYDSFTNARGLNNLIWVAAFSGEPKSDWYPGAGLCGHRRH